MILKKLIAGISAFVVSVSALSSVAVASFTSASAADGDPFIVLPTGTTKTVLSGKADASMAGASSIKISFKMGPNASFNQMTYLEYNLTIAGALTTGKCSGPDWNQLFGGTNSATISLTSKIAEGDVYKMDCWSYNWYTCTTEDNYVFGITKVEFLNDSGEVLSTITEAPSSSTPNNPSTSTDPTTPSSSDKVIASPYFSDGIYYVVYNHTPEVEITGDGQYSIEILPIDLDGNAVATVSGCNTLVIDFINVLDTFEFTAKLDSITCDGKEIKNLNTSKAVFGNLEKENKNLRLEAYNTYGPTKDDPVFDPLDLEFTEKMVITFSVSGLKKKAPKPSGNVTQAPKPTTPAVSKKTTAATKSTRSASQVAKDKAAAQKAMRQAKLKKVKIKYSFNAKKKKIKFKWKK